MKIKILFMIINMNVGGTEKALLNMIDDIDNTKYDVTILMLEKYGGFMNQIPKWVNIKYVDEYKYIKNIYNNPPIKVVKELKKQRKIIKVLYIAFSHLIYKITNDRSAYFRCILKECKVVDEEYDIAIAYAGPMDLISYYVLYKIKAKNKFQWIHFDVTKIYFNKVFSKKLYSKFNKIFVVSNEAKRKLDIMIPSLSSKTEVIHNVISKSKIQQMANEGLGFEDKFEGTRILTVGRLSKEKGQDMIMPVVSKLKSEGYNLRWYIIGDGNLRERCKQLISEYKLEENIILLGTKTNPYPYMNQCDIYVQPSRYEGYCTTTIEAKCLVKPILVTDVNGMSEQIQNNINGLIVDINIEDIYMGLKNLLDNSILLESFIHELKNEYYEPENILESVLGMVIDKC